MEWNPAGTEAPGLTEDARQSGQNERALSGTPGWLQGSNLDSEVPLTAGETGLSSDTMETSDVIPGGQDLRTHAPSCVLPGLDALGHQSQAAHLYQSSLAATIEQNLGLRPKGQGKGKQKGKGHKANQAKPAP